MKKNKEITLTPIEFAPTYDRIDYFVEPDAEKAFAYLRSKGYDHKAGGSGMTICANRKTPLVWMKRRTADVVVHEMIHAVMHMFNLMGHDRINRDNEELFAYFVDYAVKQVMKRR